MRRLICLMLAMCLALLSACAEEPGRYSTVFFGLFDTVTTLTGYAPSQEAFDQIATEAREQLERLHQIFDQYNAYEGVANVWLLNQRAAQEPIAVSDELFAVLWLAQAWQPRLSGTVNVAMGSVLRLWHDERLRAESDPASARLPDADALEAAAVHCDIAAMVLDESAQTVFFVDPGLQLDLGAVAKGYAAEWLAEWLKPRMPSFLLGLGGNVRAGEPPLDGRDGWTVSIQDPAYAEDAEAWRHALALLCVSDLSVVTSGDYQRYYEVDGARLHHIISPQTLRPAGENRSVTILCRDSALADLLSTAVFILPYAQGRALVDSLPGVEAVWQTSQGEIYQTDGVAALQQP